MCTGCSMGVFLKPRKAPKKVRGREMPNHRQSRASSVVNGIAALEPAPHRNKFRMKNTVNVVLQWRERTSLLDWEDSNIPWHKECSY